jgi:hypothetical protein
MGKKRKPQVVVVPQAPPPPSPDLNPQIFEGQLAKIQESYNAQIAALNKQFEQSSINNAGVLQTLRDSLAQQQLSSQKSREQLAAASSASQGQLALLTQQRDAQAAQLNDQRVAQSGQLTSMFKRLSQRRLARQSNF